MSKYKKGKNTPAPKLLEVGSTPTAAPKQAASGLDDNPQQLEEQARARFALKWLEKAASDERIRNSELKSYTRRLPAMIRINGFGQALAFYRAKGAKSPAYQALYDLVQGWLCKSHGLFPDQTDLLAAITTHNQHQYRLAQAETQALLQWAKKFAEAMIAEDETHDA